MKVKPWLEVFKSCIDNKVLVQVTFKSQEKGILTRKCVPYDYGPSRRFRDGRERYHFYDLDSPEGQHNLSVLPEQVINLQEMDEHFDPANFITWTPNWFMARNWGKYS